MMTRCSAHLIACCAAATDMGGDPVSHSALVRTSGKSSSATSMRLTSRAAASAPAA
jgi:hypothetical protein